MMQAKNALLTKVLLQVLAAWSVVAACLLCAALHTHAAPAPKPGLSGAELEEAIEANVEAQSFQEETTPVEAQIIKAEPAALIASGTGDISTIGEKFIRVFMPAL